MSRSRSQAAPSLFRSLLSSAIDTVTQRNQNTQKSVFHCYQDPEEPVPHSKTKRLNKYFYRKPLYRCQPRSKAKFYSNYSITKNRDFSPFEKPQHAFYQFLEVTHKRSLKFFLAKIFEKNIVNRTTGLLEVIELEISLMSALSGQSEIILPLVEVYEDENCFYLVYEHGEQISPSLARYCQDLFPIEQGCVADVPSRSGTPNFQVMNFSAGKDGMHQQMASSPRQGRSGVARRQIKKKKAALRSFVQKVEAKMAIALAEINAFGVALVCFGEQQVFRNGDGELKMGNFEVFVPHRSPIPRFYVEACMKVSQPRHHFLVEPGVLEGDSVSSRTDSYCFASFFVTCLSVYRGFKLRAGKAEKRRRICSRDVMGQIMEPENLLSLEEKDLIQKLANPNYSPLEVISSAGLFRKDRLRAVDILRHSYFSYPLDSIKNLKKQMLACFPNSNLNFRAKSSQRLIETPQSCRVANKPVILVKEPRSPARKSCGSWSKFNPKNGQRDHRRATIAPNLYKSAIQRRRSVHIHLPLVKRRSRSRRGSTLISTKLLDVETEEASNGLHKHRRKQKTPRGSVLSQFGGSRRSVRKIQDLSRDGTLSSMEKTSVHPDRPQDDPFSVDRISELPGSGKGSISSRKPRKALRRRDRSGTMPEVRLRTSSSKEVYRKAGRMRKGGRRVAEGRSQYSRRLKAREGKDEEGFSIARFFGRLIGCCADR